MPSKKKKYNARFPAGRIKKIMQSDEEIGKVAQAVPVIISRTLELFVESLLTKTLKITNSRNAKTLSPSHMKQCIMAENRFDFLRELVKNIPDISVAEEVSNDSSPEVTIDQSDTPYDLSMPSSSNTNEITTPKAMPSNGIISVIRNNGVTRSCGTTIVSSPLQSPDITLNLSMSDESRANLKRQWDAISRFHSEIHTKAATLESNSNKSLSTESSPPKLYRTDSAPASLRTTQQLTKTTTVTPTPTQSSQQQHHQQQPNQVLPTDLRRLRHQNKSVPGNICMETVTSQKLINNTSTNNNSNSKLQTPTTAIPAPIVSIDFCNKPIVKIDYSNLALHDTNYSESPSSSSSSPTVEQINRSATCIAKTPLQSASATPTAAAAATTTAAAAVTVATTAVDSPVINIDLSNIVTSGTFATSSLNPSVISPNCVGVPLPSALTSTVATNRNSYLELDEDYDNI